MKFEFMKNGFEIVRTDENKTWKEFIPYHAITSIDDIEIKINYADYDSLFNKFVGKYVEKYCSFSIFTGKRKIQILILKDRKRFPRISEKFRKLPFWKRFLFADTNNEGISKDAENWLYDYEKDMEEPIKHLTEIRNDLIKHFNEWDCLIERKA